ncbi:MAG TPA: LacI family DNA-binding transcriptional regulator [Terracidiphilus sp.]|nr:LacI family DNA-binding transcriptional regulator [Terracidiphilus sp.]
MKPPSIPDIARALGISIGTVDRALHGRPGISPATQARVLKKAEELGYRPNIAARSLKLNRRIRIAAYFPAEIASFYDPLRAGVSAAAASPVGVSLDVVFRTFRRLDLGDVELIAADAHERLDGVLLAPGNPRHIAPAIRAFAQRGLPVVCVSSDAPRSERMASVAVDALTSGAIAAELFARVIQKPGSLATITGELTTLDHAEKLRGFAANLALLAPHLSLLPAMESHEQPKLAYEQALSLLAHRPRPLGIYVSTANSLPVLKALEEKKLFGQIQVITTDLFPDLIPYIESGRILATLHQRPFAQGKLALDVLLNFLVNGIKPNPLIRLAPHIVLRSNLSLFMGETDTPGDFLG